MSTKVINMLKNKPYISIFLYNASVAFPTSFSLYIFIDSGVSASLIAYLFVITLIGNIFLSTPIGLIADFIGRKKNMIISNFCFIFTYICALFFPNLTFVLGYFIFYAFALSFRNVSLNSWLQEFSQKTNNHHAEFHKFTMYSLVGSIIGSSAGLLIFSVSKSYFISIIVLLVMYLLSAFLFGKLNEDHLSNSKKNKTGAINNTVAYIKQSPLLFIVLSLITGSVFILSLPIYLYYPAHIDMLFGSQNRLQSAILVQIFFIIMCLSGYFLSRYTNKKLLKNTSNLKVLSIFYGFLLGSISLLMYYTYKNSFLYVLATLPIVCSTLFTVLRTTSESISTNIIKKLGFEKNMSTITSLQSAFGNIIFGLYYILLNFVITLQGYDKIILLYTAILPVAFVLSLLIAITIKKSVNTTKQVV